MCGFHVIVEAAGAFYSLLLGNMSEGYECLPADSSAKNEIL